VAFVSSLFTIAFLIRNIFIEKKYPFDIQVFELIKPYINDRTTVLMNFITFFGSQYFLVPANILLILYTFFIEKDKWFAIKVLAVAISSLLLMICLKYLFTRPRPAIPLLAEAAGYSFPSGHAFMSFAFLGLLIYMVNNKVKRLWFKYSLIIFFLVCAFLIGLSRIYLRVHYASDVIAGISISMIWLVISLFILQRIEDHQSSLPFITK